MSRLRCNRLGLGLGMRVRVRVRVSHKDMSRLRSNRLGLGLEKRVRVRVSHNPNPNLDCHRRLISFRLGEILKLLFIKMDVEKTQSVFRRTDLKKKQQKNKFFKKRTKNG